MSFLNVDEAKARFGQLTEVEGAVSGYREFNDTDGVWRPVFGLRLELVGYQNSDVMAEAAFVAGKPNVSTD